MSRRKKLRRGEGERLAKDRRHILDTNFPTIHQIAWEHPGHLVMAVVDCFEVIAKHFGSEEAATHYLAYCDAKDE